MLLSRIHVTALRKAPLRASAPLSTRATKILSALDIPTDGGEVHGVYDGAWGGSGEPLVSVCPSTGEKLAKVTTVGQIIQHSQPLTDQLSHSRRRQARQNAPSSARARPMFQSGTCPLLDAGSSFVKSELHWPKRFGSGFVVLGISRAIANSCNSFFF
jgi:hypothetical protein